MTFDHTSGHHGPAMLTDKIRLSQPAPGSTQDVCSAVTGWTAVGLQLRSHWPSVRSRPRSGAGAAEDCLPPCLCITAHLPGQAPRGFLEMAHRSACVCEHEDMAIGLWVQGRRTAGQRQDLRECPASCPRVLPGCPGSRPTGVMG